jgi:hypothetical protein
MVVVFLVVGGGGGGGKKRRSGGREEVGDEAGRRCVLIGSSDGSDYLYRLRDPEADCRVSWESASEPRPGIWVAEEA